MQTLEQVAYDAGRSALADQESLVASIRQRTGTLLAAHALVASFLGGTTLHERPLSGTALAALIALGLGLLAAAILLMPWRLRFAVDARGMYTKLLPQAEVEAQTGEFGWLAEAGFVHLALQDANTARVRRMSWLSGLLAILMICQTIAWLIALL